MLKVCYGSPGGGKSPRAGLFRAKPDSTSRDRQPMRHMHSSIVYLPSRLAEVPRDGGEARQRPPAQAVGRDRRRPLPVLRRDRWRASIPSGDREAGVPDLDHGRAAQASAGAASIPSGDREAGVPDLDPVRRPRGSGPGPRPQLLGTQRFQQLTLQHQSQSLEIHWRNTIPNGRNSLQHQSQSLATVTEQPDTVTVDTSISIEITHRPEPFDQLDASGP
jgi:hypothetical protein